MDALGTLLPHLPRGPSGDRTAALVEILARSECPALTARRARREELSGAPHDPIVWEEARGANVRDVDGNVYVDLTAGFGVASLGHAHPAVVAAIQRSAPRLLHALGDVFPSADKIALLDRLVSLAPFPDARVVLGLSGSDAIEAALKTAMLATKRPGVLAFHGGYHGLAHGPLAACGYKEAFRAPFSAQLSPHVAFAPYPALGGAVTFEDVEQAWPNESIGAVIVEPVLGRGGVIAPRPGFLAWLSETCGRRGALLVVDEIFTGLHRCGALFRSVADGARPDMICIGKALGGGMPISALLGRGEVMRAWGDPGGEAIHTGTFFGHPVACAAALATLDALPEASNMAARVALKIEASFRAMPRPSFVRETRSIGAFAAIELDDAARTLRLVRRLLERGFIVLPAGMRTESIQIVPPFTISDAQLDAFFTALTACFEEEAR